MQRESLEATQRYDSASERDRFSEDIIYGLAKPQKEIPSKYLYDTRGSQLFNQITDLEAYYPARTEFGIMKRYANEIASVIDEHTLLIEYGSGSSMKTRLLLDELSGLVAYIPIDISKDQLREATETLKAIYPGLIVLPVNADYTKAFKLPPPPAPVKRRVVYYPGSTIGNFHPPDAIRFLRRIAGLLNPGDGLLIGVDLKKAATVLHDAYNDNEGLTAAFNLNLLHRINRELEATFDVDRFQHYAFYNPHHGRVEMHLVSLEGQHVQIGEVDIPFAAGETIWTESSYKYSLEEFEAIAGKAGFAVERVWTDPLRWFSVQSLAVR